MAYEINATLNRKELEALAAIDKIGGQEDV